MPKIAARSHTMIRFTMPDTSLPIAVQNQLLKEQFNKFINCDAMNDILSILHTDIHDIKTSFNGRVLSNGKVIETIEFLDDKRLEKYRIDLYAPLKELGFYNINKPLSNNHSHITILGGSLTATYNRTKYATNWINKDTKHIDGLACYRPISAKERIRASKDKIGETEFHAMSEAFIESFNLQKHSITDNFTSDRNLNSISNIRIFSNDNSSQEDVNYRVLAAPSSAPDIRRANTSDTMSFFINNSKLNKDSSILAITTNRYCNRQFIQLATEMLNLNVSYYLDIVGSLDDNHVDTIDDYNPYQYIHDVIATINLIEKFNKSLPTY